MKQPETVTATFYAVVEPEWNLYGGKDANGNSILDGAKVTKITQKKPASMKAPGVVVRLDLKIDSAALLPLQPTAVIEIHPGDVSPIECSAFNPGEDLFNL